jgi:hypothetical protein
MDGIATYRYCANTRFKIEAEKYCIIIESSTALYSRGFDDQPAVSSEEYCRCERTAK